MWNSKPTFSSYMRDFPTRETELVQLGTGNLGLNTHQLWGVNSFVSWVRCDARTVWRMLSSAKWVGCLVPLAASDEYKLNGWETAPGDVIFLDGRKEFASVASNRRALLLGVKRRTLAHSCAKMLGVDHFTLPEGHSLLKFDVSRLRDMHVVLGRIKVASKELGKQGDRLFMPCAYEADLIQMMAEFFLLSGGSDGEAGFATKTDFYLVERAVLKVKELNIEEVTLATLCEGAGVGKSTLHSAFVEELGVSPMQYILKMRLTAARERLLDHVSPPLSVKEVALRYGFASFGRFAQQYGLLFDERPSETLKQTRARSRL